MAARGVGVPVDDVADAADAGMPRVAREQGFDAGIVERGKGNNAARQAARVGHGLQPFGFLQRVVRVRAGVDMDDAARSEEHTSELQSLMRISYAVFCLNHKTTLRQAK